MIRHHETQPPVLRGDGQGYHLWVRGLLTGDIHFCNFSELAPPYAFSHEDKVRNICQVKYPPGVGLFNMPALAVLLRGHYDAPELLPVEHWVALAMGSILLLAISILATLSCATLGIPDPCTGVAVLAIVFGTGMFLYATYSACGAHVYTAFEFALLLWALVRNYSRGSSAGLFVSGLAAFLVVLTRNVDGLAAALLLAAYAWLLIRRGSWSSAISKIAPGLCGLGAAAALQFAYNWYAVGHFSLSSYGPERFHLQSHALSVAFSCDRGLLPTYPVIALVVVLGVAVKRTRTAAMGFLVLLAVYVLIYGSWSAPGLGFSFGPRGLVDFMPLAMPLFAASLAYARPKLRTSCIAAAVICALITSNLALAHFRFRLAMENITWNNYLGALRPGFLALRIAGLGLLYLLWLSIRRLIVARQSMAGEG